MIFEEGSNHEIAQQVISVWADDHLVWGKSLDSTDQVLTDTTKRLLPPFIQAYLEAFIGVDSQRFEDLCQTVKGIPLQVINLEFIRRRISSDDRRSNMEKRILEISAKVDRLITNTGRGSIHAGSVPCLSSYVDAESRPNSHTNPYNDPSTTSVPWEACSALISVPSETGASYISSAALTPTAEPLNLSSALDGSRVHEQTLLSHNPLYDIPSTWRKPVCLKSRDVLINISQQAIDFIENYGQPFTLKGQAESESTPQG
ncbi:hypothetical protein FRC02_005312 [Tulasnella sp. 418]|nr:hypothetical protein FRC02_005312 [Tulasnella sp. 418]